jgi:hypothetical protein
MDLDNAATFLLGSVGYGMGFILWIAVVVVVNNLLHKHWKPVKMFTPDSWKAFNPPIHRIEPHEVNDGKPEEKRNA